MEHEWNEEDMMENTVQNKGCTINIAANGEPVTGKASGQVLNSSQHQTQVL